MNQIVLKGLILSFLSAIAYASLSIIFGLFNSSSIILIDGIYTLIGAVLTLLNIYTIKFIQKEDFESFPFGKESLAPLMVFIQYTITLLVSIINLTSTIYSLNSTNVESNYIFGLTFAIGTATTSLLVFQSLRKRNQQVGNNIILQAEIQQWKFGHLFSLGIIASFILALILEASPWHHLANWIDPMVSIIITLFFILTAIKEISNAFRELLSGTPKSFIRKNINDILHADLEDLEYEDTVLRSAKIGNQLVIEIDIIIKPDTSLDSVTIQDQFREKVSADLYSLYPTYNIWLNITFTANIRWSI